MRAKPPFRADHVGSLLRPSELASARQGWKDGKVSAGQLRAAEDKAISDAVALQKNAGLRCATDGEFRRDYWHLDFMWGFEGVSRSSEPVPIPFSNNQTFLAPMALVTAKVSYPKGGIMREHYRFLHEAAAKVGVTPKFTAPAPTMFRSSSGRQAIDPKAYPDPQAFWPDIGRAYNDFVRDFASLGCRYLQLDDVNTALLCTEKTRERLRSQGLDPERALDSNIAVLNQAIAGRPKDMVVTTHMCRGNFRSAWMAEGGYEAVAEKLLAQVEVDGFFMEYDTDRAGDFAPLRFLPKGKIAVLGLVSSKIAALESKDELKRRIDQAARFAPLERLALSPQCGFSSTHHGNDLSRDDQRRKLELVVQVAEEVWGGA